jgi:hypothetical protein
MAAAVVAATLLLVVLEAAAALEVMVLNIPSPQEALQGQVVAAAAGVMALLLII